MFNGTRRWAKILKLCLRERHILWVPDFCLKGWIAIVCCNGWLDLDGEHFWLVLYIFCLLKFIHFRGVYVLIKWNVIFQKMCKKPPILSRKKKLFLRSWIFPFLPVNYAVLLRLKITLISRKRIGDHGKRNRSSFPGSWSVRHVQ